MDVDDRLQVLLSPHLTSPPAQRSHRSVGSFVGWWDLAKVADGNLLWYRTWSFYPVLSYLCSNSYIKAKHCTLCSDLIPTKPFNKVRWGINTSETSLLIKDVKSMRWLHWSYFPHKSIFILLLVFLIQRWTFIYNLFLFMHMHVGGECLLVCMCSTCM